MGGFRGQPSASGLGNQSIHKLFTKSGSENPKALLPGSEVIGELYEEIAPLNSFLVGNPDIATLISNTLFNERGSFLKPDHIPTMLVDDFVKSP
jgi:hypothetical protein